MTDKIITTPFERRRIIRNSRILCSYLILRRKYPLISNSRIYKMIAEKEKLTHDSIRLIVKAEGKEIPKRTQA